MTRTCLITLATALSLCAANTRLRAETETERAVTAVIEEYNDKLRGLGMQLSQARTDAERAAIRQNAPRADEYAPRILQLAEQHPDDPGAVRAICWLATQSQGLPEAMKALELLGGKYAASPGVWQAAQLLYRMPRSQAEPILSAIREKNPNADDRCAATHALATLYFNDSEGSRTPEGEATREKAAELFEEVISTYPSVTINGFKPADQAIGMLFELRNLQIGAPAPEIEGKDVDGASFKLSDYQGRPVVLVFWGSWCHSCHYFLPRLRDLAARFAENKNEAAVVGVNSDILPELKTFLATEKVPWRNFCDESSTGPISSMWNIRNWPTIYLLDEKGVIRARNPAVDAIPAMLGDLVAGR